MPGVRDRSSTPKRRGGVSTSPAGRQRAKKAAGLPTEPPLPGAPAGVAARLEVPAEGVSVAGVIWAFDTRPTWWRLGWVAATCIALPSLPFAPAALACWLGEGAASSFPDTWAVAWALTPQGLAASLGVDPAAAEFAALMTGAAYAVLLIADWVVKPSPADAARDAGVWPRWLAGPRHAHTYDSAFFEPARRGRLLRRLGNTLSNATYTFAGLLVLSTATGGPASPFAAADALFGVFLLLLGAFSVAWHASNAMKTHYPDLWAMEGCIVYLILRFAATAALPALRSLHAPVALLERPLAAVGGPAGALLLLAYVALLVSNGRFRLSHVRHRRRGGWLDEACKFSARYRLRFHSDPSRASANEDGRGAMTVAATCGYAALPVFYLLLPLTVCAAAVGGIGDVAAATATCATLAFGWGYRMTERWALDWHPLYRALVTPANFRAVPVDATRLPAWRVLLAALLSPTAALHTWTGFTLAAGFAWARSVEARAAAL